MANEYTHLEVAGLQELIRELDKLPRDVAERMERKVLRKSLKVIAEDAKSILLSKTEGTGGLAASIRVSVKKYWHGLIGRVVVNKKSAHLIESGHWMTTNDRGPGRGRLIKWVPARQFLRPAFDREAGRALDVAISEFNKALDKLRGK